MKEYKYLLRLKYWESYLNWKTAYLMGYAEWRYSWWIAKCNMIKRGEI
jgi:hypothetical protein